MGLVNNHDFLGSAESAYLENTTLNQITGLLTPSHEIVQDVAMASEVVATRSRSCEKTVNLVGLGKLNTSVLRQR